MTMFSKPTSVPFVPASFVDEKMPQREKVMREIDICVCTECGTELEYICPTYTCQNCGETYTFKD